jgi:uncharacterized protein YjbJ (UPF0337 family)
MVEKFVYQHVYQHDEERTMNDDIFKGKWKQLQGQIQQKWGDITNDDLDRMQGTQTEFEGLLQERYGYTKERAKQEVDNLLKASETQRM